MLESSLTGASASNSLSIMLVLRAAEVTKLLPMSTCIQIAEQTFRDLPNEQLQMPPRLVIREPRYRGVWLFMPVYSPSRNILALKTVSEHQENQAKFGLPKAWGFIVLYQAENGVPLCMMDSVTITAMRTGAMTGVAAKYLAREDSERVGMLGSGQQAETQLMAVCSVRKVRSVKVYSSTKQNRNRFSEKMSARLSIMSEPVDTAKEAVENVDILLAATNASLPVFDGAWIRPGMFIATIGTLPDRREVDALTIRKSRVFGDVRENVLREAGDVIAAVRSGYLSESAIVEMSEVVSGKKPGRMSAEEITLFKSVGFAFLDLTTALHVYQKAKEGGVGTAIDVS